MDPGVEADGPQYVIPPTTLSGSGQDLLEQIDDMMDALQLVREAVVARMPKPARPRRVSVIVRLLHAITRPGRHGAPSAKRYPTHGSVSR